MLDPIRMKHLDKEARISVALGEPDETGGVMIPGEQVATAQGHGFYVCHTDDDEIQPDPGATLEVEMAAAASDSAEADGTMAGTTEEAQDIDGAAGDGTAEEAQGEGEATEDNTRPDPTDEDPKPRPIPRKRAQ